MIPPSDPWMQKYLAKAKDLESQMKVFCASLTDLDTQIGRLLDTLDEMGLAENTIIVLSSDNGPEDYRIGNASNAGVGSPGPLRGRKRSMYEGGIRTFGLVRWPGKVPAGRLDETSVVGAVDFLPTICSLAKVEVPPTLNPDGQDLSPLWLGGETKPRENALHWEWLFTVQGSEDGYVPPAPPRDPRRRLETLSRSQGWKHAALSHPQRSRGEHRSRGEAAGSGEVA